MANVDTTVIQLAPVGGTTNAGVKIGLLEATTKASQNDTVTIQNASEVIDADLKIDADGVSEPYTISANEITLTSATTGSVRGTVYYKP